MYKDVARNVDAGRLHLSIAAAHPETAADDFDTLLAQQPSDRLLTERLPRADDVAGYFHTGGTTGTPKLVRHTHANQVSQAWGLRLTGIVAPGQGLLFGLPLFHVGGALTQGLAMLANGGHVVVLSALGWRNPRALQNVWRLVQRYRPAVFGGVPTVLAAALGVPVEGADLSSIRTVSGGGSAIPALIRGALYVPKCDFGESAPASLELGTLGTASASGPSELGRTISSWNPEAPWDARTEPPCASTIP